MSSSNHPIERTYSNIALIGFMGVGKTTCGKLLARALNFTFLDTDQKICEQTGSSISDIFKYHGEEFFRAMEKNLVYHTLANLTGHVIATGGGLGGNPEYLEVLRHNSLIVHLCLTPEGIYERIKNNKKRPLLNVPDPLAKIRELLNARLPFYRTADLEITTLNRQIPQIVFQILLNYPPKTKM